MLLVEATDRIGGMITSGLSHTGFRSREGLTGAYLKFSTRVDQHYRDAFGTDSPQVRDCWNGVFAEPKVNLAVFEKMISEQPNITLWKNRRVFGTRLSGDATASSIGLVARIENDGRTTLTVTANYYIDATYEGDLIAAAKCPIASVAKAAASTTNRSLRSRRTRSCRPTISASPRRKIPRTA
ncbi:MAG: FAD-dependent oxidoreductase [Verrucomicrobia bacterium]|nr:FAD-dependent oxidoreductase [Verrucomicrobiota bacterium]